jgi:predicted Zn finger-like uncharacterized protein
MSLVTQCAHCGTTFHVTQQQLQAHNGKVRCGACMTVFNGIEALVTPPKPAPEARLQDAGAAGVAGFELEPVAPTAPAAERAAAVAAHTPETAREEQDYGTAPEQLSLDYPLYGEVGRRSARWWAAGVVLLAFVLVGQAAYLYRADLAAQYPGLKPYLVQFCDLLRCTVSLPQRPKQIAIEASDLQATNTARLGIIRLTATLRNHAGHELGYPALDLVLTNTKEHTLARRIFLPKEYLERGRDVAAGIPANAEITVRLDLDTGDLNPAGFRLDLLPAPQP